MPDAPEINVRALAVELGDHLKYETTVNEIDRAAATILGCTCDSFPNQAITSVRAQRVYDWVLSAARHHSKPIVFSKKLVEFITRITPHEKLNGVFEICARNRISAALLGSPDAKEFYDRAFHSEVQKHAKKLFLQQNYFHAVFEACKAFNNAVREKGQNPKGRRKPDVRGLGPSQWNAQGYDLQNRNRSQRSTWYKISFSRCHESNA
jgi:Protein of unknown function (Hypoth_ymh)